VSEGDRPRPVITTNRCPHPFHEGEEWWLNTSSGNLILAFPPAVTDETWVYLTTTRTLAKCWRSGSRLREGTYKERLERLDEGDPRIPARYEDHLRWVVVGEEG
jgi:hypothetical protein